MDRLRTFLIFVTLCTVAIVSGTILAVVSRSTGASLAGYIPRPTPALDQAAGVVTLQRVPTATARPSATPAPTPTNVPPTPTPAPATITPSAAPAEVAAAPAAPAVPPDPGYIEYTVQRGDLLYNIAKQYQVTMGDILAINQIGNPDSLTIGEVIHIPKK